MKRISIIEHTGDIGLSIQGNSLEELFVNAVEGLSSILFKFNNKHIDELFCETIDLTCFDLTELFVSWLSEFIYFMETKDKILVEVKDICITDNKLKANCVFCKKNNVTQKKEIKAVTYHNLNIVNNKNIWQVDVFFDL